MLRGAVDQEAAVSREPSLWDRANVFAKLFNTYQHPLLKRAAQEQLEVDTLPDIETRMRTERIYEEAQKAWRREVELRPKDPHAFRAVFRFYFWSFVQLGIIQLFEIYCFIGNAIILGELVRELLNENGTWEFRLMWAALFSFISCLLTLCHHQYFLRGFRLGVTIRLACCSLVYAKTLRLSLRSLGRVSTGQVVNLFSTDFMRFEIGGPFFAFIVDGPLHLIAVLLILSLLYDLGLSALAGLGLVFLMMPLQSLVSRALIRFRSRTVREQDLRVRLVNEIVAAARILKVYAWETPVGRLVAAVRGRELASMHRTLQLKAFNMWSEFCTSVVAVSLIFTVHALRGFPVHSTHFFVAFALLVPLMLNFNLFFPLGIEMTSEILVGTTRLTKLLLLPEQGQGGGVKALEGTKGERDKEGEGEGGGGSVEVEKLTVRWTEDLGGKEKEKEKGHAVLRDVSLTAEKGELLVVVGPVGAGKSSLLYALCGELEGEGESRVRVTGRMAMVEQEPWVMGATVRENIAFGRRIDEPLLEKVVNATALRRDLEILPAGLDTEVGEKGTTLSGGQKARLALARAAYAQADVNLLDDPLSAVDPPVANQIVERCILAPREQGGLRHPDAVTVLVTHQVALMASLCPDARLVVLNEGAAVFSGRAKDVAGVSALLVRSVGAPPQLQPVPVKGKPPASLQGHQEKPATGGQPNSPEAGTGAAPAARDGHTPASTQPAAGAGHGAAVAAADRGQSPGEARDPPPYRRADSGSHPTQPPGEVAGGMNGFGLDLLRLISSQTGRSSAQGSEAGVPEILDSNAPLPLERGGVAVQDGAVGLPVGEGGGEREGGDGEGDGERRKPLELKRAGNSQAPEGTVTAAPGGLTVKEGMARGAVGLSVYLKWMAAARATPLWIVLFCLMASAQSFYILAGWWLATWSSWPEDRQQGDVMGLGLLWIFAAGVVVTAAVRSHLWMFLSVSAARQLHADIFSKLLRAPISFFDTNPTGRIVNRFSRDVAVMDEMVSQVGLDVGQCILRVLGTIIFVCIANVFTLAAVVPLIVWFFFVRRKYLRASTQLKRLDGVSRSPVYNHLSTTLSGLATLRTFGLETASLIFFFEAQNENTICLWNFRLVERWFGFTLDSIVVVLSIFVAFATVAVRGAGLTLVSPQMVGLSLVYTMQLAGLFQWAVRQSAELDNNMTSVERVLEYGQLPQEAEPSEEEQNKRLARIGHGGSGKSNQRESGGRASLTPHFPSPPPAAAPAGWPSVGRIEFIDVTMTYKEGDAPALRHLSFQIQPREKIGVVGRSGAGKSSILAALFRLTVPEGGCIRIDGVETSEVRLATLRSSLSIIPQTPILFSGTVRSNLDPFNEASDEAIWEALEAVQLSGAVRRLPNGLDTAVGEGDGKGLGGEAATGGSPEAPGQGKGQKKKKDVKESPVGGSVQRGLTFALRPPRTINGRVSRPAASPRGITPRRVMSPRDVAPPSPSPVETKDGQSAIMAKEEKEREETVGMNFSVGERQLLCMARAIVRRNKILLLDEATANVDPHTDQLIQRAVRERFTDCVVITIAHRLSTIIDSDRILVMDAGRAAEFDTPARLLEQTGEGAIFSKMVEKMGRRHAANLREIAKECERRREGGGSGAGAISVSARGRTVEQSEEIGAQPPVGRPQDGSAAAGAAAAAAAAAGVVGAAADEAEAVSKGAHVERELPQSPH
uniref:Uncharacterized protein n=1 Tax=Chromera velia CCMP2878 TaxID=1169474 RepID=A0A0G4HFY0_9ALVE|eukprot:Cvel_27071.t1-p1 / transcript=Cvel_27071.t1 / gene=Cvel_27071 / organism=Chromera_velia_CCMP2878 / gene_product=Multidrug resistance-associated protein 4, putative / transcript_product=Multidrug resistance-associated protein 4, putative / location=Cvel_scaffold3314:1334-9936(-) / protein_length=1697 / sequence_SO=supercontig / SO=protein_coding / is_pseudo=false